MIDPTIFSEYDARRPLAEKPFRSVCYAPFVSVLLDTIGLVRVCDVNFGFLLGDIRRERLKDIWRGERIKVVREAVKAYRFDHGCDYCRWKIAFGEFEGKNLTNSSIMTYKFDHLPVQLGESFWPRHMEFHISNVCNLECETCWGEYSSAIRRRRERLPRLPSAYGEEFFEDLTDFLPHLLEAQFLGGEPFLIREHHRIWNMLIDANLAPKCHVVTNGTQFNEKVERWLELLPMSLAVSVDGATKETFERIRVNAEFDTVLANVKRFREITRRRGTGLSLMFTLSRMNWFEFADVLLLAEDVGATVSVASLFEPRRFSLFTLARSELADIVERMEQRTEAIEERLVLNRSVWRNHLMELKQHLAGLGEPQRGDPLAVLQPLSVHGEAAPDEALKRELREWSGGGPVIRLDHDPEFLVTRVAVEGEERFGFTNELVGQTIDDATVSLKRAFGSHVRVVEEQWKKASVDRIIECVDLSSGARRLVKHVTIYPTPGSAGLVMMSPRPVHPASTI